jgi:hypothetical protein
MGTAEQDFTAFYDATWSRTVACAYAVTGELAAAEDVAQDAYAKAWPRWSKLTTYDDPGAWVRQVGSRVLVLQLPSGSTPPPDAVSVKVGQVLESVLERLETTGSPLARRLRRRAAGNDQRGVFSAPIRQRMPASRNPSMSPSKTACGLPTS